MTAKPEMKPDSCPVRERLAQSIAKAVHETYLARHDLQAAQADRGGDTAPFIIALERARSKQREAQTRLPKTHRRAPLRVERHQLGAPLVMSATILILDAEEVIRSVITRILEREGYTRSRSRRFAIGVGSGERLHA